MEYFDYATTVLSANIELIDMLNEPNAKERKRELQNAIQILSSEGYLENTKLDGQDVRRIVFYKNI